MLPMPLRGAVQVLGPGDATSLLASATQLTVTARTPLGPPAPAHQVRGMVYKEEEVQWRREFGGNSCSEPNSADSFLR